jgi:hypothetical protein
MYNKFFTVEVKPPIKASLLNAAALASDDDVIFSWTPFEVPKGSSRLLNVTARVAGNDGTAQHHPFQLLFAKGAINASTGIMEAPASIGTYNTVAKAINSLNQIQGGIKIEAIDYMCQSLVGCSIASTGNSVAANGSNVDMVLTPAGSPHATYLEGTTVTSITPGYDVLWVAGIACGAFNFASTVTTDGAVGENGRVIHTDTKDANLVFSKGDVIQELDNTVIGTIFQIDEVVNDGGEGPATVDVDIHVDRLGGDAIADGVRIYHRNPITLELSFEK